MSLLRALFLSSLFLLLGQVFGQNISERCGNQLLYENLANSPVYTQVQEQLNRAIKGAENLKSDTVIRIPVVVHVVYKNVFENISDAQIYSQLDVINQDFRKLNADTSIVKPGFSVADVKIEFCLAHTDPNGNFTTGITRTFTNQDDIGIRGLYFLIRPTWGADQYLNIWVCDFGSNVAGQGFPPGSPPDRDGVVIDYTNFGTTGTVIAPYDKGRTLSHEIGHFLNLFHIWGQNDNFPTCLSDDLVSDTPNQNRVYTGCQSGGSSCNTQDMLSNFMGYEDDRCMANFTAGQKTRMRSALLNARTSLVNSDKGCLSIGLNEPKNSEVVSLYPNPSKGQVFLKHKQKLKIEKFQCFNTSGQQLPVDVSYSNSQYQINLNSLPSGIYFLRFQSQKESFSKRIILNNK